jgi:hypothetical protein
LTEADAHETAAGFRIRIRLGQKGGMASRWNAILSAARLGFLMPAQHPADGRGRRDLFGHGPTRMKPEANPCKQKKLTKAPA